MKNIVICCDGTGNEISENISNVLKLYRTLRKTEKTTPRQMVFYDPGVGTLARPNPWKKWRQDVSAVFGLATGYGLDDNVLNSYEFIVDNYEEGDAIYLFGFSRGAYTVRVLAGLIHKIGLISKPQTNLAGSGLTAYKQFSSDRPDGGLDPRQFTDGAAAGPGPASRYDQAAQYARILSVRWPTVKFVGVWDTVASVIVPRPDRLYWPSLQVLAFVHRNPSIEIFRQAMSIDEKRRLFRLQPWQNTIFMPNRFSKTNNESPQDSLQVWFAGVHADIGGGYPEIQSGLSKYPLLWMIEEAVKSGLRVDRRTVNQLGWGRQRKGSPFSYVKPDFMADPHNSMTAAWRSIEYFPKKDKYKEWPERKSEFGYYIPDCEPRLIPEDAFLHQSAVEKIASDPRYRPVNIPAKYQTFPMPPEPPAGPADDAEDEGG
ncbi:DUF2235 domain-containing protein [Bradyrhizobium sediminis]|uniref:DUF2235 domain-containing protein n=1 Tax=Bradyrhizobium sediminis TaxID=2840469 RepID=A0A975RMS8_9BRAD|nr:DUF2235 domain-containing protein [Bradyrhizobium sediminis]QWG13018.1 DUF2235 domain-containing protein [Bradyrhizobium sediminis]